MICTNSPYGEAKRLRILKHFTQSYDYPWWKKCSFYLHCVRCLAGCFWTLEALIFLTIMYLKIDQAICTLQLLAGYLLSKAVLDKVNK